MNNHCILTSAGIFLAFFKIKDFLDHLPVATFGNVTKICFTTKYVTNVTKYVSHQCEQYDGIMEHNGILQ